MGRTTSTHPDRAAVELHEAVSELVRVYQFRDRDTICCHDISVTQCYALETIVQRGPLRLQELAALLHLDKSTMSRVVGALVRKRYVERLPEAGDARAVALRATPAGRTLYQRITRDLIAQEKEVLGDLDARLRGEVAAVLRRLARAADARFRCGVSVGDTGREAHGECSVDCAAPVARARG